jgi:hypothetical protein
VNRWLFVRYLVIGIYVGCATCAGFAWWYLSAPVRCPFLAEACFFRIDDPASTRSGP